MQVIRNSLKTKFVISYVFMSLQVSILPTYVNWNLFSKHCPVPFDSSNFCEYIKVTNVLEHAHRSRQNMIEQNTAYKGKDKFRLYRIVKADYPTTVTTKWKSGLRKQPIFITICERKHAQSEIQDSVHGCLSPTEEKNDCLFYMHTVTAQMATISLSVT